MMNCCSQDEASRRSGQIDKNLKKDKSKQSKIFKILLLGSGECGKSTVMKQLKIIHLGDLTKEDRLRASGIVRNNALESIKELLKNMTEIPSDIKAAAEEILAIPTSLETTVSPDIGAKVLTCWQHEEVQNVWINRGTMAIIDNAPFFLDAAPRILGDVDYVATQEDYIKSRVMTTGLNDTKFNVKGIEIQVYDVGGQRSERRKWLSIFDNVQLVLFVASLSEYNQCLREAENVNRMEDSLALFKEIINNNFFIEKNIVLFMNKSDLFNAKLQYIPLETFFPDFPGGDRKAAYEYIVGMYKGLDQSTTGRQLYLYETCATDTGQVKAIWNIVQDTLIQANLAKMGLV